MQGLCLYGPRKSKPRLESELSKQQYTVTLFDCNHLTHVIVLFGKFMCYCTVFVLFYFGFEGTFQVQVPGVGLGGAIYRVFLRYEFGGLIFGGAYAWRGYFRYFTVYFNLMEKIMNCRLQ